MAKPELMGLQQLASNEFSSGLFLNQYALKEEPEWINDFCGPPRQSNGLFFDYGWSEASFAMLQRTDGWQLRRMKVGSGRLEMVNWRDGFHERDDNIRRDVFGIINRTMGEFATGAKRTLWHRMAVSQLELGSTLTSPVDGVTFFGSTHVLNGSPATQRNVFTASEDSRLNVTLTGTGPTALELADAFRAVIKGLYAIKDGALEQPNGDAKRFHILVHSDIAEAAQDAATLPEILGTAGVMVRNRFATKYQIKVSSSARLASANDFYVKVLDGDSYSMIRVYEDLPSGPDYQLTTPDGVRFTHHDMSVAANQISGEHQMLVEASRNMGFGDWYSIAKGTLS